MALVADAPSSGARQTRHYLRQGASQRRSDLITEVSLKYQGDIRLPY
ncbi:hypothetical protein FMEAI12_2900009 [Parafrankia sp. Ea1.12]|nr:hypothetical protein FMEAI12_2900009 [Parafrankia sp. Ea1.12]